jgi:hypothetical protein
MIYPTMKEVEKADREQLARWHRFLPSPGAFESEHTGCTGYFKDILSKESRILNRIETRFSALGGFTPEISKKIGWENKVK